MERRGDKKAGRMDDVVLRFACLHAGARRSDH